MNPEKFPMNYRIELRNFSNNKNGFDEEYWKWDENSRNLCRKSGAFVEKFSLSKI